MKINRLATTAALFAFLTSSMAGCGDDTKTAAGGDVSSASQQEFADNLDEMREGGPEQSDAYTDLPSEPQAVVDDFVASLVNADGGRICALADTDFGQWATQLSQLMDAYDVNTVRENCEAAMAALFAESSASSDASGATLTFDHQNGPNAHYFNLALGDHSFEVMTSLATGAARINRIDWESRP